jgi:hypothetical protein
VTATLHEVPLPPPERPEREHERRPDYEHVSIAVGASSVWVADVQRGAREFAGRHGSAISLEVELGDGRRLDVSGLRAGPGESFVTLCLDERELAVRLDRIVGVELAPAREGSPAFRVRQGGFGFGLGPSD